MPPPGVKRVFLPWEHKLELLRNYKEEHGHTNVPKPYTDPETGFFLGKWVQNVRQNRRLHPERVPGFAMSALDEMGFVWKKLGDDNHDNNRWEYVFGLVKEFRKENPNRWPKSREKYRGENLGFWLEHARRGYRQIKRSDIKGARHTIQPHRVEKLNSIGFPWNLEPPRKFVKDYTLAPATLTVRPEMSVTEALQFLQQHGLSEAPVVERNTDRLVGHLRLFDIFHKQATQGTFKEPAPGGKLDGAAYRYVGIARRVSNLPTVAYIMSYLEEVETVSPKTPMSRVAAIMTRDRLQQLPVVDDEGILLGILQAEHVLKDFIHLIRHLPEDESNKYEMAPSSSQKVSMGKTGEEDNEEEGENDDNVLDEDDDEEVLHDSSNNGMDDPQSELSRPSEPRAA
mmetsp:Transcript_6684/g.18697  ORF Transcript_6684/g.18697 Transcript_6684/m.18697 type:complete len:398 (-) Transcript_6684:786-1979(-)